MITISSDAGRIGSLWWFNSDTRPANVSLPAKLAIKTGALSSDLPLGETDFLYEAKMTRWGTFGFGFNVRIAMAPCE